MDATNFYANAGVHCIVIQKSCTRLRTWSHNFSSTFSKKFFIRSSPFLLVCFIHSIQRSRGSPGYMESFFSKCDCSIVPGRALLDPPSSAVLFVPAVVEYVVVLAASARSRVDRPSSPRSVHVRGGEAVPGPGRSSRPSGRRRSRDGYALVDTAMVKRSLHPAEIQIIRARGVNSSVLQLNTQ